LSISGLLQRKRDPPASILLLNSFDPTSTYPEIANASAESTKEERQTQGREKHPEDQDEPR
jgi:hypothetical protein